MTENEIDKSKFVHLHVHNAFSFRDGIGNPQSRIDWAKKNKIVGIATSNHGNIADWIAIYLGAKEVGIKPILGCEFYFKRGSKELEDALLADKPSDEEKAIRRKYRKGMNHATMFAKNLIGYHNMLKIHNDAWMNRFYFRPIVSDISVENNNEGIIALSGCTNGEINSHIKARHYLQSDQRLIDVKELIKAKIKIMTSVFKTKNLNKLLDDKNTDFFDIDYFNNKSDDKFDQSDYIKFVKKEIDEQDTNIINSTDEKIDQLLDWWVDQFGNDFYLEIMTIRFEDQKIVNEELIKLSKKKNIPLAITNDSHYLTKNEAAVQELQMLSDQKVTYEDFKNDTDEKIWTIKSEDLYYKTIEEMYESWEEYHKSDIFTAEVFWEGIYNVTKIVDSVEEYEIDTSIKMPKLYDDELKIFTKKISDGMKTRNISVERLGEELYDKYVKQVKKELKLIKNKGYIGYFLIVEDIVKWAKDNYGEWAVGGGRGSAAGSLVTYLIGITNIDPIKHDLMFFRFLDPGRNDTPDIDCLHELTPVITENGNIKLLQDIKVGDVILDHFNNKQKVLNWATRTAKKGSEKIVEIVMKNDGELGSFICPGHHRMIKNNNEECFVYDLNIGDEIKSFGRSSAFVVQINEVNYDYNKIKLCDIQIENTETFQIYPFKVNKDLTAQNSIFSSNQ